jgi:hypothetical protein
MTRARTNNRRKRVGFGVAKLKMNLDDDTMKRLNAEGKVPRWFNDKEDRIQRALESDYEFVTYDGVRVGDKEEGEDDRRIKKHVGRGVYAYLMAIPKEYYDEDQAAKEETNMMVDEAIRGGTPPGVETPNVAGGGTYKGNIQYKP